MSANLRALRSVTRIEMKLFLREPVGVFFTVAFPMILILVMGASFGNEKIEESPGYDVVDFYIPGLYGMIIANLGLMSLPVILAEYRTDGVFKRYKTTPVPIWVHIAAQAIVHSAIFVVSATCVTLIAIPLFDLKVAGTAWQIAPVLVLGVVLFYGAGFLLGGGLSSIRTVQAVGGATFFTMMFASGTAIPKKLFPDWLQDASEFVPLTQLADPLVALWTGDAFADQWVALIALTGMSVAVIAAAIRWFRWQA